MGKEGKNKEVQTIKVANALQYDGTDSDYEHAVKIQKANEIGDTAAFKALWNGNKLTVKVLSDKDASYTVMLDNGEKQTRTIKAGSSMDLVVIIRAPPSGGRAVKSAQINSARLLPSTITFIFPSGCFTS